MGGGGIGVVRVLGSVGGSWVGWFFVVGFIWFVDTFAEFFVIVFSVAAFNDASGIYWFFNTFANFIVIDITIFTVSFRVNWG